MKEGGTWVCADCIDAEKVSAADVAVFHERLAARRRRSLARARAARAGVSLARLGTMLRRRRDRAAATIPRMHLGALRRLRSTPALEAARGLVSHEGETSRCLLVLLGPCDAGKSVALAWLVLQLRGVWLDGEILLDAWRDRRSLILAAPLVAIDDVGRGGSPEQRAAAADVADAIVKLRLADGRPVAIGGNLTLEGLASWWSSAPRGEPEARDRWTRMRERLRQHGCGPGPDHVVVVPHLGLRRIG